MPGLVALAPWEEPPDPSLVERLLDRAPHRAAAGRATLVLPGCALGTVSGLLERDERRGLALAADVRLDNQDELESALAPRDERPSLAELLLLGWERWGTGLAERLAGDFALVIWDERRRQLYAARDAFGVRPLFHARSGRSLVLASEVGQLLALEDVDGELEDGVVLDFLASRFAHGRETFFRGIARVRPGHFLLASSSSFREVRWFEPPREELRFRRKGDCEEAFRALARSAVARRLDSDRPVIVQMSGGLDSSSIACLAGEISRRNGRRLPHLLMVSASFPGLRCDET